MKTKILIGLKFIGLAAILLAACSTGNGYIILVAVAVLLFLLVGGSRDDLLINPLMFWGAGLGLFIRGAAFNFANATRHQRFGIDVFIDSGGGFYLILVGLGIWVAVAKWANEEDKLRKEKTELEKSWVRMILNPNNLQEIRRHPEHYRDDFKQWIKEIQPDLLLQADRPQESITPTGNPEN